MIKKQLDNINSDYKNKLLLLKEKDVCRDIYNEELDKIEELTHKINYNDLKLVSESSGTEIDFSAKKNSVVLLNDIKKIQQQIQEAKKLTRRF